MIKQAPAAGSLFFTTDCQHLDQLSLLKPPLHDAVKTVDNAVDQPDNVTMGSMMFDMLNMQFPSGSAPPHDKLLLTDGLQHIQYKAGSWSSASFLSSIEDGTTSEVAEFDRVLGLESERTTCIGHTVLAVACTDSFTVIDAQRFWWQAQVKKGLMPDHHLTGSSCGG